MSILTLASEWRECFSLISRREKKGSEALRTLIGFLLFQAIEWGETQSYFQQLSWCPIPNGGLCEGRNTNPTQDKVGRNWPAWSFRGESGPGFHPQRRAKGPAPWVALQQIKYCPDSCPHLGRCLSARLGANPRRGRRGDGAQVLLTQPGQDRNMSLTSPWARGSSQKGQISLKQWGISSTGDN